MFKFSGKISRGQWWVAIAIIFPLFLVSAFSLQVVKSMQQAALYSAYGSNNSVLLMWLSVLFSVLAAGLYISGMSFTARRLRDAGYSRSSIIAYYWLIVIFSFFAMFVYLFIAGFSPSQTTAEDRQEEQRRQAEARAKAAAEQQRREEEVYRRGQAEAWAREDESRSYAAGAAGGGNDADNAAYADQAKKWADEEAEKEQKQLTAQKDRLLPKG